MANGNDNELSPGWKKARVIFNAIAAIFIPVAVVWVSQDFTSTLKDNEIGLSYVELAIGILQEEPGENRSLRRWATDVVRHYSEVPLTEEIKSELIEKRLTVAPTENIKVIPRDVLQNLLERQPAVERQLRPEERREVPNRILPRR